MYQCPQTYRLTLYGPPKGWEREQGTETIDAKAEWDKFASRGLLFEKYDGPSELITVSGDCLAPLMQGRTVVRTRPFGPDESPMDHGLYIFECPWKDGHDSEKVRAYCAEFGVPMGPKNVVLKFLRWVCGEWYYVSNQGIGSLHNAGGVIKSHVIGLGLGTPGFANSDTGQIGLNAATSTLTSSLSGSAGSFTAPNTNGSVTVGPFPVDTTVILTVTGQWNYTFTGVTVTGIVLRYGISTTTGTFTGALVTVDTSTSANSSTPGLGPLTQEIQVSLPANTTTYNVLSGENPSGIIGTNISITGIIKAEAIKR